MMQFCNQINVSLEPEESLFELVKTYVLAHYSTTITIEQLARAAGLSRYGFCRKFYRECKVPPIRWLWHFRILLAARLIERKPHYPLALIGFECGFKSAAHFCRAFKAQMGVAPSRFRKICLSQYEKGEITEEMGLLLGVKPNDLLEEVMIEAVQTA